MYFLFFVNNIQTEYYLDVAKTIIFVDKNVFLNKKIFTFKIIYNMISSSINYI